MQTGLYIGGPHGNFCLAMLQKVDPRLAAIGRCRHVWEVRERLRYPEAKAKLKHIALAEERVRAGAPEPVKRRVIRVASPVTEERIERFQVQHAPRGTWRWWR